MMSTTVEEALDREALKNNSSVENIDTMMTTTAAESVMPSNHHNDDNNNASSSSSSVSAVLKQRRVVRISQDDSPPETPPTDVPNSARPRKSSIINHNAAPASSSLSGGAAPPVNLGEGGSGGGAGASNVSRRNTISGGDIGASEAAASRNRLGSLRAGSVTDELIMPDMQIFSPKVIVDGTKLILRLGRNETFVIDRPCKLLMVTSRVKIDRPLGWQISGTGGDAENTVVIDSGLIGHPFVPIPLAHYGTVYTRDGTVHVVVGSSIHRAKVHSRFLPYRTCNKFHSVTVLEKAEAEEVEADTVTDWFIERQLTNNTLASLDPSQASKLIKHLTNDTQAGVVYIRADDSIMRYKLRHDEKVELHSGCLVAWTVGVRFEQSNYCCFRFVSAVHGEGTIWIQNSKTRALTAGV